MDISSFHYLRALIFPAAAFRALERSRIDRSGSKGEPAESPMLRCRLSATSRVGKSRALRDPRERQRRFRAPLKCDRPFAKHDHLAADTDAPIRADLEKECRWPPGVLALRNFVFLGQRPPHREVPAPEVRRGRAGGRVLDHRPTLRKEEAREQPTGRLQGREQISHSLAAVARKAREDVRNGFRPSNGSLVSYGDHQLLRPRIYPQWPLAYLALVDAKHARERGTRLGDLAPG